MTELPTPAATTSTPSPGAATGGFGDRRELAAVVVAVALGGGLGVLATAQAWSTVAITRLAPLGPVRHDVGGRTLQPGVTGLAVVALAGVLALLATRGVARRVIGAVLVLAGAGMVWWSLAGLSAVSAARGRQLVANARTVAGLGTASATSVTVHPAWVVLAAVGGALVVTGGVVTAARGGRWRAMSARYESPVGAGSTTPGHPPRPPGDPNDIRDPSGVRHASGVRDPSGVAPASEVARARADLALWQQLDRGEDPTVLASAVPNEPEERDESARTDPVPPGLPTDCAPPGPQPDPAPPGPNGDPSEHWRNGR